MVYYYYYYYFGNAIVVTFLIKNALRRSGSIVVRPMGLAYSMPLTGNSVCT